MDKKFFLFCVIILLSFSFITSQDSQNILTNGDFEESQFGGGFKTLKNGDEFGTWKVIKASVDLNGNPAMSYSGNNSVDLNGTPGVGAIEQIIKTKKGKKYKLRFHLAGNIAGSPDIKKLRVNVADEKRFYDYDGKGLTFANMPWEEHEIKFKARSKKTKVQFISNCGQTNPYYGPIIDAVEVVPAKNAFFGSSDDRFFGFKFGILGGTSYYFIDKDEILDLNIDNLPTYKLNVNNASFGIHFGISTQFKMGPVFLRPDLVFNSNTINYQVEDILNNNITFLAKERYQYLDVPVLLGVDLGLFRVMGGPVGHVFLANQSNLTDDLSNLTTDFERLTLGYQLGAGIDFFQIQFDLRYEGNLNKLGDGILYNGEKIYFSKNPGRLIATLTFLIN